MKRFVLDCSVSAGWYLADESSERTERYLELLRRAEATVPSLWVVEMTNTLTIAERRGRIAAQDVELALETMSHLPITVVLQDLNEMPRIHDLAVRHGLTAYDASYLDLALTLRLPLATLDGDLAAAARARRVRLL